MRSVFTIFDCNIDVQAARKSFFIHKIKRFFVRFVNNSHDITSKLNAIFACSRIGGGFTIPPQ